MAKVSKLGSSVYILLKTRCVYFFMKNFLNVTLRIYNKSMYLRRKFEESEKKYTKIALSQRGERTR